jgi:predicted ATPase with chaperone activity
MRTGNVVSNIKQVKNEAGSSGINEKVMSARKLENEQDTFVHKKVSLSMSKRIAQTRCAKKMTQKELALHCLYP